MITEVCLSLGPITESRAPRLKNDSANWSFPIDVQMFLFPPTPSSITLHLGKKNTRHPCTTPCTDPCTAQLARRPRPPNFWPRPRPSWITAWYCCWLFPYYLVFPQKSNQVIGQYSNHCFHCSETNTLLLRRSSQANKSVLTSSTNVLSFIYGGIISE